MDYTLSFQSVDLAGMEVERIVNMEAKKLQWYLNSSEMVKIFARLVPLCYITEGQLTPG